MTSCFDSRCGMPVGFPVKYSIVIDSQNTHQMDQGGPTGNTPLGLHPLWEDGLPLCLLNWEAFRRGPGQFESEHPAERQAAGAWRVQMSLARMYWFLCQLETILIDTPGSDAYNNGKYLRRTLPLQRELPTSIPLNHFSRNERVRIQEVQSWPGKRT